MRPVYKVSDVIKRLDATRAMLEKADRLGVLDYLELTPEEAEALGPQYCHPRDGGSYRGMALRVVGASERGASGGDDESETA